MADPFPPHRCDFCSGTVWPIIAQQEIIRVCDGVVLIEGFRIGKCDRCGHRYFPAEVVKRAERAAAHPEEASRMATIPIVTG